MQTAFGIALAAGQMGIGETARQQAAAIPVADQVVAVILQTSNLPNGTKELPAAFQIYGEIWID